MDCIVHEVAKSWTRLSDFHFHLTTSRNGGHLNKHTARQGQRIMKLIGSFQTSDKKAVHSLEFTGHSRTPLRWFSYFWWGDDVSEPKRLVVILPIIPPSAQQRIPISPPSWCPSRSPRGCGGWSWVRTTHSEHAGISCDSIGLEVKNMISSSLIPWLAVLHNYSRCMFHGVKDLGSLVCFWAALGF